MGLPNLIDETEESGAIVQIREGPFGAFPRAADSQTGFAYCKNGRVFPDIPPVGGGGGGLSFPSVACFDSPGVLSAS